MVELSPLAPAEFPSLPRVKGIRIGTAQTGIRYKNRDDLLLVECAPGSAVAGALTTSRTASAPVLWCRKTLKSGRIRALLANAGNANAFTGRKGETTVKASADAAAALFNCRPHEIAIASTGVIGVPLPVEPILAALPRAQASLADNRWRAAADAIRTTDTFPKGAGMVTTIANVPVAISGIAKGSGMIAPNMATMFAFVFTDANIAPRALAALVSDVNERTFNSITVDSDTSTSDTLIVVATSQAGNVRIGRATDPRLKAFRAALESVMRDLALQVVRDGEGAQKLIEIAVSGATSDKAAHRLGMAIANSPLIKTAIAGADANWGRIVMAVGKSGEALEANKLKISIGGVQITARGAVRPEYDEAPVVAHIKGREVKIAVDVGVGHGQATVWTCDLTHGYIAINADYRS
jgi:glutamate N-acetyltransferase / amino-acid N-acetyltransferase